jgi:hypothetical protein
MSALPPKASIDGRHRNVRFVPIADIRELIGANRKTALAAAWVLNANTDRSEFAQCYLFFYLPAQLPPTRLRYFGH